MNKYSYLTVVITVMVTTMTAWQSNDENGFIYKPFLIIFSA
jgi:hypothetical protein